MKVQNASAIYWRLLVAWFIARFMHTASAYTYQRSGIFHEHFKFSWLRFNIEKVTFAAACFIYFTRVAAALLFPLMRQPL